MGARSIIRVAMVLVVAGAAAITIRTMFVAASAPKVPEPPKMVVAAFAASDLTPGLLIRPEDVAWTEIQEDRLDKTMIVRKEGEPDTLVGAVVRREMAAGTPIESGLILMPNVPGFLSAALKPDMRAVSVAIDAVTGNAGLILPGDFVDLLLTQGMDREEDGEGRKVASETILANLRVIAVGSTLRVDNLQEVSANDRARTVTLEVLPRQAEVVAVATQLGHLSLVLRSFATLHRPGDTGAEQPNDEPHEPVWAGDVSAALRLSAPPPQEERPPVRASAPAPSAVQVIRGSQKESSGAPQSYENPALSEPSRNVDEVR